jgi:glyoxylase-like metal-dependent hydrolase (beta-lactamase superfamily II)
VLLTRIALVWAGLIALVVAASNAHAQPSPDPLTTGTVTTLRGDLYRVQVGNAVTVLLVTTDGLLLADPLDRAAAAWLKGHLAERFPGRLVKYVIHTSHEFERAEGASQFRETAEIVAHRDFEDSAMDARRRLGPELSTLDRNRDGALQIAELASAAAPLKVRDADGDGRVTSGELYAFVQVPERTYIDRRTITLGGRTIEVLHPGPAFGPESTAILFPAERVIFVNHQPVVTGPLFEAGSRPRDVMRWVRTIAALDADVILTGRGETMPHRDVVGVVPYLNDLFREVVAASESGRSDADVQASPALDAYRGTPHDTQRPSNIAALRRGLRIIRVNVHATGAVSAMRSTDDYCLATYTQCESPRLARGAITGVTVSWGRVTAGAELMVANQSIQWRTSPTYDDAIAHRETTASFLAGYASPPARRLSFTALGGVSYVVSDVAGMSRRRFVVAGSFAAQAGPFALRRSALGYTGGAEIVVKLSDTLGIVAPVRVTRASPGGVTTNLRGPLFVQSGIGLRYRLYRSVH